MFSEELSGNANRKRQDANRERRRKLKQEQQKKALEKKKKDEKDTSTPDQNATAKSVNLATNVSISIGFNNATSSANTSSGNKQLSAVEIANAQRQQRLGAQVQKTACTKMQSFYRSHRSNCVLLNGQHQLLTNRLQDLSTLRGILKENANTDYIPPPATCTAFCQQILFLSQSLPYKASANQRHEILIKLRNVEKDSRLVQQIFDLVLIPGLTSADENINPFAVWLQSPEGTKRIRSMIRLALVTATNSLVNATVWKSCLKFVRIVTVSNPSKNPSTNTINTSILEFCRPLLLTRKKPNLGSTRAENAPQSYLSIPSTPLDLISLLRHHLLYATGGGPIPPTASKSRESCIPPKQREQADDLFQTVLSIIQATSSCITEQDLGESLMLQLFSEILTVPILTWKLSNASIQSLCISGRVGSSRHNQQPYFLSVVETVTNAYGKILTAGDVESVLCDDISLKKSTATPIQCLLANMIQLGNSCVSINGSQVDKLDFEASTIYFRFLATLVDATPVSTFSCRDSVVEWVTDGGHHFPVVISPIILEHCRALVADGWVRKLFKCAMDLDRLQTDEVLRKKTEKDLKMEKELYEVGSSSGAALAAKEARVDRDRTFWKSSGWARSLSKGVSKMLHNNNKRDSKKSALESTNKPQGGKLINASSMSRKLAMGGNTKGLAKIEPLADKALSAVNSSENRQLLSYSPELFKALCCVFGIILARWGGSGGEDIIRQKRITRQGSKSEVATTLPEPFTKSFLSVLCFSTEFIRFSWGMMQSGKMSPTFDRIPVKCTSIRPAYNTNGIKEDGPIIFYLFIESLAHQLILTDDTEIHDMERPLPLHQLRRCIVTLKQLLYKACCVDEAILSNPDAQPINRDASYFGLALIKASSRSMWDLYDRSSRRLICVPNLWIVDALMETELRRCKTENDYVLLLSAPVLRVCPFLVSFKRRLRLFERIVYTNRAQIQGENSTNPFHTNPLKPGIPVRITRGRILEDGLATMNNLGSDMRRRISIQYYNEAGAKESGIDAGGLFKEFWTDLCAIAFDPNYALFRVTEENFMYPNPSSGAAHGSDHIELFKFLGRILGKSLYESITVHPQFAHFFLSFLRGDYNYLHMFSDLSTIDSQLYNNLMFLKTFDGDAEDLCLTFTVSVNDFGGTREIPLIPNGGNIDVTNANKHRYIGKCKPTNIFHERKVLFGW
jgi:ubiquitin-protein ligase E3 C